ncbi:GFA family protein [Mesorhizobium sp. BR1-1-16]|uniref:GFA family protein n=1 Tax=Mesorhizobium sp. BR1-1-16 TaxID=2876653 RepID=UPI001CCEB744|nr:GFA family protein [Mesorhizobium sp. BR1-1-16]MBZ9936406.1 GFA family protein [Mesorhizobium sp. BR1-1-16]
MERLATCACGELRVTCSGEPEKVSLCHCPACQKRTGSAFGIAAFFGRDHVRIEGPSRSFERPSDSGFPVLLHFCPDCGSTVFWEPRRKPDMIAVGVGSFADPTFPAPSQAVYAEFRHPWVGEIG